MARLTGKIKTKTKADEKVASVFDLPALGFLELKSISRGLFLTDVILKKAPVKVITSQPISSGKHVVLYFGDEASVDESHKEALLNGADCVLKEVLIPGVHEDLVPFLDSLWSGSPKVKEVGDSVGIVESLTLAGAVLSADKALKTANVSLVRMRLGQGIGGKAYFVLTGRQEDVEAALEAAEKTLIELESLERVDVIPRPMDDAVIHF
jgi:microcompartment protein CcmL/EutN